MIIFVGAVSISSLVMMAASDEAVKTIDSAPVSTKAVAMDSIKMQAVQGSKVSSETPVVKSENETTLPATGWILFLTLIGFVALSNRHGV